jgi:predicted membrane protein
MLDLAFQYNIQNLQASVLDITSMSPENLTILGVFLGSFVLLALLYKAGLYIYGYALFRRELREKENKKNTIQDLILMKNIQGELEREMEEALLKSALIQQN